MVHIIIFLAFVVVLTSPIYAQKKISPLDKISRSFSDDQFGRTTMPKGAKLARKQFNPACAPTKLNDCVVIAANGLELYYSPYDGLNSKTITIDTGNKGAIRAFNIGTVRSKKDVLAAAITFVPELTFDCRNEETTGGLKTSDLYCRASVPEKWNSKNTGDDPATVMLTFGGNGILKSAMVMVSSLID